MNTFETLFTKNLKGTGFHQHKGKAVKLLMAAGYSQLPAQGLNHVWVSHEFTDRFYSDMCTFICFYSIGLDHFQ